MNLYWPSASLLLLYNTEKWLIFTEYPVLFQVHYPVLFKTTLNEGVGKYYPHFTMSKARRRKIQQVSRRDRDLPFCVNSFFFCTFCLLLPQSTFAKWNLMLPIVSDPNGENVKIIQANGCQLSSVAWPGSEYSISLFFHQPFVYYLY